MLSFASSLSPNSDAFVLFVTEKYDYKDKNAIFAKELVKKIDSFLKSLKAKNKTEAINSIDISDKKKCFVIQIKNKYENYYSQM